ncbi:hypothetical protein K0U83_22420 [bacterium]|nr:hypothetical protein [bacterium]
MTDINDLDQRVTRIEQALSTPILPSGPVPPEPVPRPELPTDFRIAADVETRGIALMWGPLSAVTPGVQVQRRGPGGWASLTKTAVQGWRDVPPANADTWTYRIRGFNEEAEQKASAWSQELEITFVPEPGPGPDPGGYVALDRVDKTAEENKAWRVPAMLANRTGRTIGGIGDVRRGDWTEGDLVKENLTAIMPPPPSGQWNSNLHQDWVKRPGTYTWANIEATGAVKDVLETKLLWGTREYNCPERYIIDCDFSWQKEHGAYLSPYQGSTVDGCTFVNIGAQGLQYAHRPGPNQQYGPDCFPYEKSETYTVNNSHMIDCGRYPGRASFSLTYFTCGSVNFPSTIRVTNSSFVAAWSSPNSDYFGDFYSTGAMVATAGDWPDGNVWTGGTQYSRIELINNLYDYTTPDRSILSIRSVDELLIQDCAFIVRDNARNKAACQIDSYVDDPTIRSNRVTLRNVSAPGCRVQVKNAGSVDMHCPGEEVVIDARTGTVISRRPIS